MKKRKVPKHIVLPNGMWRFVSSKSNNSKRKKVVNMSKKKKSDKSGGNGCKSGGNGLMSLLIPAIGGAISGVTVPALVPQIPVVNTSLGSGALGGFLLKRNFKGALAGAVGAFASTAFLGGKSPVNQATIRMY